MLPLPDSCDVLRGAVTRGARCGPDPESNATGAARISQLGTADRLRPAQGDRRLGLELLDRELRADLSHAEGARGGRSRDLRRASDAGRSADQDLLDHRARSPRARRLAPRRARAACAPERAVAQDVLRGPGRRHRSDRHDRALPRREARGPRTPHGDARRDRVERHPCPPPTS